MEPQHSGMGNLGTKQRDQRRSVDGAGRRKPMTSMTRARQASGSESLQFAAQNKVKTSD
jgi:hypothetical protein